MSTQKVSEMPPVESLTGTEIVPLVKGGFNQTATTLQLANLPLTVSTTYPVTDSEKAGQRFLYKGNQWHYMTQDDIDSCGWTGLVGVGFPAPVYKTYNLNVVYNGEKNTSFSSSVYTIVNYTGILDILGLGNPIYINVIDIPTGVVTAITGFKNLHLLINLVNAGTASALYLVNLGLTAEVIDDLFTQLPITVKTA